MMSRQVFGATVLMINAWAVLAQGPTLWRYEAVEDVTEHAKIDLDVSEFSSLTGDANWTAADDLWMNGKNSFKTPPELRTLEGFSSGLVSKADALQAANEAYLPEFELFKAFYGDDELYGKTFVENALAGTGSAAGLDDAARNQLAKKGVQYQVVHMYVLRELYESVKTCTDTETTEPKIKAWDEGVAFYVGSEVPETATSADDGGSLLWTFAQKRCPAFGTCDTDGAADANVEAFEAFNTGKTAVLANDCSAILEQILVVRKQMQIPLLQGVLYYTLQSDAAVSGAGRTKQMAEAWAFLAGVLPYIAEGNPTEAATLRADLEIKTGVTQTATRGYEAIAQDVYKVLPALCISCEEIGAANVNFEDQNGAIVNLPTCVTDQAALNAGCDDVLRPATLPSDPILSTGAIAGIAVAGVVVLAVGAGMLVLSRNLKTQQAASSSVQAAGP